MKPQPPVNKPPRVLLARDAIGVGVVLVISSFVLGTRFDNIQAYFATQGGPNEELPADLNYQEVEEVYDLLRSNFDGQMDVETLLDGMKQGLAESAGDDYTTYLTEEESQEFLSDLNGTFTGIGAELGNEGEQVIIVAPIDGFPAQEAGLRARDAIIAINGEDTFGMSVEEAVVKIRGEEGTEVTLTVLRGDEKFDVTITREKITIPSVTAEIKDGIGILRVSRFAEDTTDLARQAAENFRNQNVKGVILDLRNNSGGYLSGAVDLASLWLDNKVVVEQRVGNEPSETLKSRGEATLAGVPTILLVNQGSASASEIVAGALQDHDAATLVGTTTYGKGSVQELEKVQSGGTLKVTVAHWFTPNGTSIEETGITPDVKIDLTEKDIQAKRDSQLERAKEELR